MLNNIKSIRILNIIVGTLKRRIGLNLFKYNKALQENNLIWKFRGFKRAETKLELFCHVINEHKYSFDFDIFWEEILKKLLRFWSISVFCEKFVISWMVFCGKGCASEGKLFFSCILEPKDDDIIFLFKFKININIWK